MKIIALLFVVCLALASFGPASAAADGPEPDVVSLVNATRQANGLAPLTVSSELTASARAYAHALATEGFFAHVSPDGSTMATRDEAAGYTGWTYLEENLAGGQPTPNQAVAAWLASPGHRANILSPDVTETGVGFVQAPGATYVYYWVQEFGRRPAAADNLVSFRLPQVPTSPAASWTAPNGYAVTGDWLGFIRAHGDVDTFGLPASNLITDPVTGQTVQYFQRAILEWHPENAAGHQIEPRLLGDILFPGADPPVSPDAAPPGPATYFPLSTGQPTGLGHFVADFTRSGQAIYFKSYFDSHGGASVFGYPKEEPKLRDGQWTQRFQAAVFEYHPENDRDGSIAGTTIPLRNYRVELALLADQYLQARGSP